MSPIRNEPNWKRTENPSALPVSVNNNISFTGAFALRRSSSNCFPAPDLVFSRLSFPTCLLLRRNFFSQTPVGYLAERVSSPPPDGYLAAWVPSPGYVDRCGSPKMFSQVVKGGGVKGSIRISTGKVSHVILEFTAFLSCFAFYSQFYLNIFAFHSQIHPTPPFTKPHFDRDSPKQAFSWSWFCIIMRELI